MEKFEVVIVGAGSGGKPLAGELSRAGLSVMVIERDLVGGECPFVACIPSKAMLNAAQRHRLGGPHTPASNAAGFAAAVALRNRTTGGLDDSHATKKLLEDGARLLRGQAEVVRGPDEGFAVSVTPGDGGPATQVGWNRALVIGTGAQPDIPPIDGLDGVEYWTSDVALSSDELPGRLIILGGGVIGCELGQVYASFGCKVTIVQTRPTLLAKESAWVGESLAQVLGSLGADVRTGQEVTRVRASGGADRPGQLVATIGGEEIEADRILVATGKTPRTSGFGLELLGLGTDGPIPVDARMRASLGTGEVLDDVFAIGDVTALAAYTHVANYHARTVAEHLLGNGIDADHTGIPRVTYTHPAVLCTGLTATQAEAAGYRPISARWDARETSRSAIERTAQKAHDELDHTWPAGLELVADAGTGVLLGAFAVGPDADSWAAELPLAVRTRTTVTTLAQVLHAFPSWTEAIHPPARELAETIAAGSAHPGTRNRGLSPGSAT